MLRADQSGPGRPTGRSLADTSTTARSKVAQVVAPTPFPELNAILDELVDTTRAVLADNFVGAYLQGSFAVGDADEHSDVDFLIVTEDTVTPDQEARLAAMHAQFPDREVSWAQHLEGSYVPRRELRRFVAPAQPWLYIDNGSRVLERSVHDNDLVVRWVLHNHGLTLVGPPLNELVDQVEPEDLRQEMLTTMREWADALVEDEAGMDNAWHQPHVVLSYCRMLQTFHSGRVTSKLQAGRWALTTLEVHWQPLIQHALDHRPDPWVRVHQPADPWTLPLTWEFIEVAVKSAAAGP